MLKRCLPYLYLVLFAFIVHGLALLDHSLHWDDWVLHQYHTLPGGMAIFKESAMQSGTPLFYFIIRFYWLFHFKFIYALNGILATALVSCLLFAIVKDFDVDKRVAFFIALVVSCAPGSTLTSFNIIVHYYLLYGIFFVAAYVGLHSIRPTRKRWARLSLRVLALALFLFTFSYEVLLCFYLLFYFALYLFWLKQRQYDCKLNSIVKFIVTHVDFLIAPILFRWYITHYFPVFSYFSHYNIIHFHALPFLLGMIHFFVSTLLPCTLLFFLIATPGIIFTRYRINWRGKKPYWLLVLLGLVGFICGSIPYVLVGKIPSLNWLFPLLIYNARHCFLMPVAIALLIGGLLGLLLTDRSRKPVRLAGYVMTLFIVLLIVPWWITYFNWLGLTAVQNSIIYHMQQNPQWKQYSFFFGKNEFPLGYLNPPFRSYSYAGMLGEAYGGDNWVGHSAASTPQASCHLISVIMTVFNLERFGFHFDKQGRWAVMRIQPGAYGTLPTWLGLLYGYYYWIDTSQYKAFLTELSKVTVQPVNKQSLIEECSK